MNVPILSSKFFEKYTPDLGFFTKWRSMYHWNDQIMPIYEWQDILYVGCANLPATMPKTQQKVVYLLCDPEELKRVWYNFEGTVVVSRSPEAKTSPDLKPHIPEPAFHPPPVLKFELEEAPAPQSLDEIAADDSAIEPLDLGQQESVDKIDLSKTGIPVTPEPKDDLELPELTLTYQSPNSINLGSVESVQEITPSAPLEVADQEVTMEVKFDPAASAPEASSPAVAAAPAAPKVTPSASPQSVAADPMEALMAQHGGSGEENLEVNLEAVADGEKPKEEKQNEEGEGLELLDLGGPAPAPSLQATASAPTEGSIKLEPLSPLAPATTETPASLQAAPAVAAAAASAVKEITNTASIATGEKTHTAKSQLKSPPLEAWAEKAISEVKLEFEKVMILLRTGDQVKPWRWDEDFKSSSATLVPYSLIPASPFRIVNRTHKSYHGYVVTNDFNQKFFAQWNDNEVPEHMTIAPILNQEVVVGMILGIGKKSADTKGCLQLVEDKAATLASHITATPSAA